MTEPQDKAGHVDAEDAAAESRLDDVLAARRQQENKIIEVDEPPVKLVIFQLAESFFALPGHSVKEVLGPDTRVSFVPGMPAAVEGVINLRGDIESVLSLNQLLQLPTPESAQQGRSAILLCHGAGVTTGIRIDCLHDVTDIAPSQLKPVPESLPEHLRAYVTALLSHNGWTIAVLDLNLLLQGWQAKNGPES